MGDPSRVEQLYADWLATVTAGSPADPETLCRDEPHLAVALRERIAWAGTTSVPPQGSAAAPPPDDPTAGETRALPPDRHPPPATAAASARFAGEAYHARGNLGVVNTATDTELNRRVAVKRVRPDRDGEASRRRFLHEAEITGRLEHPGVVPVYTLGADADGRPFYAMRFVTGESLQQALDRFHAGPALQARSVAFHDLLDQFIDVCQAVAYAHNRGVVHGDLKPANVMLGRFGETYLVDWGLARPLGTGDDPIVPPGESAVPPGAGTPAYMSPQQAGGESATPADDVFSLGAVLYAILTGRRPFEGASPVEVVDRGLRGAVTPARQWKKGVPAALEAVARKAMAPDPAARYATADDLAADVRRWLADEPVRARRETLAERAARVTRRYRGVVVASAVACVLLAAGAVTAAVLVEGERREAVAARAAAERRSEELRESLYVSEVGLAQRAIQVGHVARAAELLARQEPPPGKRDLRGFAWHYLKRLLDTSAEATVFKGGHGGPVEALAVWPDGHRAASAAADGSLAVWDLTTGRRAHALRWGEPRGRPEARVRLSVSADGRWLVAGGPDGHVRVWSAASLAPAGAFRAHRGRLTSLAVRPDGSAVAIAGLGDTPATRARPAVGLWSLPAGDTHVPFDPPWNAASPAAEVVFAPDGSVLVCGTEAGELAVCDPRDGSLLAAVGLFGTDRRGCTALAIGPSGKLFATGTTAGTVGLWDMHTLRQYTAVPVGGWPILDLSLSPDGRRMLVVDSVGRVDVLDGRGNQVGRLRWDGSPAACARYALDARAILSGRADGTVVLHPADAGADADRGPPLIAPGVGLAFTPDGRSLVAVAAAPARPPGYVPPPETQMVVADAATGAVRVTPRVTPPAVRCYAVSPDGSLVALAGEHLHAANPVPSPVLVFDAAGRPVARLGQPGEEHQSLAFSPDGRLLAAGTGRGGAGDAWAGEVGRVRVWDVRSGRAVWDRAAHPDRVTGLAFSPDGTRLASASRTGAVRLWDAATGRPGGDLEASELVVSVAFSPDGKLLAGGGGRYPDLRLSGLTTVWDTATGKARFTTSGHSGLVSGVRFSPDSTLLATVSFDGTARLWSAADGAPRATLRGDAHANLMDVWFTPDGKSLIGGGGVIERQAEIRVWDVATRSARPFRRAGLPEGLTAAAPLGATGDLLVVCGDGTVERRTLTGERVAVIRGGPGKRPPGRLLCTAVSPGGDLAAAGCEDGKVYLWRLPDGETAGELPGHPGAVTSLAFAPGGGVLAAGTSHPEAVFPGETRRRPGAVWLWDVAGRRATARLPEVPAGVSWLAYTPDGRALAWAEYDRRDPTGPAAVHLTDAATLADRVEPCPTIRPSIGAVSPDGRVLILGGPRAGPGSPDGRVQARRLPSLEVVTEWTAHGGDGSLDALALTPDGDILATGGGDLNVRLWRMAGPRPEQILSLPGHTSPPTAAAFDPAGKTLATADAGGRVWFWRAGE